MPLVETVAKQLRSFIVDGGFAAGDRLPSELQLMKQLKVSRPVLREAVNRLAAIGLLSVRHGSGTFVAGREWLSSCTKLVGSSMTIEPRELLWFVEFRRVLESHAARKAATAARPEQLAALEGLLEQALNSSPREIRKAMEADFRFHCMLVEIGGNPLMRSLMELLQEFTLASMLRTQRPAVLDPEGAKVHRAILQAIRTRSPRTAERAIHAHMDLVVQRLETAPARREPRRSSPRRRRPG